APIERRQELLGPLSMPRRVLPLGLRPFHLRRYVPDPNGQSHAQDRGETKDQDDESVLSHEILQSDSEGDTCKLPRSRLRARGFADRVEQDALVERLEQVSRRARGPTPRPPLRIV